VRVMTESLVRERIAHLVKAIVAKDVDAALAFYAPDVVSFDLDPPLGYAGIDRKRRAWRELFDRFSGSIHYEVHDLSIVASEDLAIVHALNHVRGTLAHGGVSDTWVRWTSCWRRTEGQWRIVHDHVSVPADVAHGKAMLDLTP
jgi:ketosteroid isomerase-like protein